MDMFKWAVGVLVLFGAVLNGAAQTQTYSIGDETPILDASFYTQGPAGKFAIGAALSNDGRRYFVTALDLATLTSQFYLVDAGAPGSWRRILANEPFPLTNEPICWTPDDTHIIYYNLRFDPAGDRVIDDSIYWNTNHGIWFMSSSMTRKQSGNWRCVVATTVYPVHEGSRELVLLPVLPNGDPDTAREPVQITALDITAPDQTIWSPYISADGESVVFNYVDRTTGEIRVYTINSLDAIVGAHTPGTLLSPLAPVGVNDPALVLVRAATGQSLGGAALSGDNTLVFMQQDFNGAFSQNNPLGTLPSSDFDLVVAPADVANAGYRVVAPGNQYGMTATPGGARVIYMKDSAGVLRAFAAALRVATQIDGTQLGGNDVQTVEGSTATDGGGTVIGVPPGLTIDFPDGAPQEIQIATPATPVGEAQLPADAGVDAIPVVRQFGPTGTVFSSPIVVTITYTDAEVRGLDEANLKIFLRNETTGIFDIPVTTIISRDTASNTISFTVDHFSSFGLGGEVDTDGDGTVDNEDSDDDNDGVPDAGDTHPLDTDNDGVANASDDDDDGDGITDSTDSRPFDTDNDGTANAADDDDDGDGVTDSADSHPFDTDNDGQRNDSDADDDNDGLADDEEGGADVDGDGLPNSIDRDSDGDGASDAVERSLGSDPYDYWNPTHVPVAALPAALVLATLGACMARRKGN